MSKSVYWISIGYMMLKQVRDSFHKLFPKRIHQNSICTIISSPSLDQWSHEVLFLRWRIIHVPSSLFDPRLVQHSPFPLNPVFGRAGNKKAGFARVMSQTCRTGPSTHKRTHIVSLCASLTRQWDWRKVSVCYILTGRFALFKCVSKVCLKRVIGLYNHSSCPNWLWRHPRCSSNTRVRGQKFIVLFLCNLFMLTKANMRL